jgi:hypothetical protein
MIETPTKYDLSSTDILQRTIVTLASSRSHLPGSVNPTASMQVKSYSSKAPPMLGRRHTESMILKHKDWFEFVNAQDDLGNTALVCMHVCMTYKLSLRRPRELCISMCASSRAAQNMSHTHTHTCLHIWLHCYTSFQVHARIHVRVYVCTYMELPKLHAGVHVRVHMYGAAKASQAYQGIHTHTCTYAHVCSTLL